MQSAPLGYMCCCKDHLEALLYNLQALPPGMDESSRGPRAACGLLSLLIPVHYVLRVCPWRPLPRNPGRLFFSHEVFCRGCSASFLQGGLGFSSASTDVFWNCRLSEGADNFKR